MVVAATVLGTALILVVLWDGFEAMVLPRRVTRRVRLTRVFYRTMWRLWSGLGAAPRAPRRRERFFSYFGPLSMLMLIAFWGVGLIAGFALLLWAANARTGLPLTLYMSATTFTTLGIGDVTPHNPVARALTAVEAALGFGFLALVIGYLPVLYQAFSRREASIALLDARAGSPSTAGELLRRHARARRLPAMAEWLREWERWAAELLESHISYPVLCYFRSQHDNQSWLASLTTVMDTCATLMAGVEGAPVWQAQLTFAMGRHSLVDLAQILNTAPRAPEPDRLPPGDCARLREMLAGAGGALDEAKLAELRRMYEPYVRALASYLRLSVPAWLPPPVVVDNWQTSAWERRASGGVARSVFDVTEDEHS